MVLTDDEVRGLLAHMRARGIDRLEVERRGYSIRLKARPPRSRERPRRQRAPSRLDLSDTVTVRAEKEGAVRIRMPDGGENDFLPGTAVMAGDVLAFLSTGPILRPLVAPCAGRFRCFLVKDGEVVGPGDPVLDLHRESGTDFLEDDGVVLQ